MSNKKKNKNRKCLPILFRSKLQAYIFFCFLLLSAFTPEWIRDMTLYSLSSCYNGPPHNFNFHIRFIVTGNLIVNNEHDCIRLAAHMIRTQWFEWTDVEYPSKLCTRTDKLFEYDMVSSTFRFVHFFSLSNLYLSYSICFVQSSLYPFIRIARDIEETVPPPLNPQWI